MPQMITASFVHTAKTSLNDRNKPGRTTCKIAGVPAVAGRAADQHHLLEISTQPDNAP